MTGVGLVGLFAVGVVFGAVLVIVVLKTIVSSDAVDEELEIAVRRLLLDPSSSDADKVVGDHLKRLRKIMSRRGDDA